MAEKKLTLGEGTFTRKDAILLVDLIERARNFLPNIIGAPPALDQMTAIRQRQQELQAAGAPLDEVLTAGTDNPVLGFGAGILKGPGPPLRLLQGGVPTGIERTTRLRPRAPMRQEIVEFPQGGKANEAIRREKIAKILGRGRQSLLDEQPSKNTRALNEKASLIVSRRGGRITFDTMRDDFVVRNKDFFDGGANGKMLRFTTLDKAEDFILTHKKWFGPELAIFKE